MYKVLYETDNGKRNEVRYKDAETYIEARSIINTLVKDSSVTDIYLCVQLDYTNAYMERKCKLSSAYGMVVRK